MKAKRSIRLEVLSERFITLALTVLLSGAVVLWGPWWAQATALVLVVMAVWRAGRRAAADPISLYGGFFAQLGSVVVLLDDQDRVVDWNEEAEAVLELKRREAVGRTLNQLELDADCGSLLNGLATVRQTRAKLRLDEFALRRQDGGTRYIGASLHPLVSPDGYWQGAILLGSDLTEKRRVEQELKEKQEQLVHADRLASLGEMFTTLAHELNQPLNAIKIGSDFLLSQRRMGAKTPTEVLNEVLDEISKQSQRASDLVSRMRMFSRRSKQAVESATPFVPLNLTEVIDDACSLVRQQLSHAGVQLLRDHAPELPMVQGDSLRLEQVFVNLLLNALDAVGGREQGEGAMKIELRSRARDKDVLVVVRDNGVGISDDMLSKVFEPFFTTKEVGKGTGLGLSICFGIVHEHGGRIEVESEMGRGTTFTVKLPAMTQGADEARDNAGTKEPACIPF